MAPSDTTTPPPATWDALADDVRLALPGTYITNMQTLRDLEGSRRSDQARAGIIQYLSDRRIGWLPDPLPDRRDAIVVLYQHGTEVGDLIRAIISASRGEAVTRGMARQLQEFGVHSAADDAALRELGAVLAELEKRGQRATEIGQQLRDSSRRRR